MRAFIKGVTMGSGRKAAGKPHADESSVAVHSPKTPLKSDKTADNPNHREDFTSLLHRAVNRKAS